MTKNFTFAKLKLFHKFFSKRKTWSFWHLMTALEQYYKV